MKSNASLWRALALLLAYSFAGPYFAQTPRPAAPPKTATPVAANTTNAAQAPDVTFDTLLAADSYAIYGELRGIGRYVNSKELTDLIAPLQLPGTTSSETLDLFNFVRAHAEELQTARVLFAASPVRPKLPNTLVAAELSSPEQAQQFAAALRKFIAAHEPPATGAQAQTGAQPNSVKPDNTNAKTNANNAGRAPTGRAPGRGGATAQAAQQQPSAPSFFLTRAGALVVASDSPFTLADLRPTGTPFLTDEPGFQAAHSRFAHEPLFVYFNTKRMQRNSEQQRAKYEREAAQQQEEMRRQVRAARRQAARNTQGSNDNNGAVLGTATSGNANVSGAANDNEAAGHADTTGTASVAVNANTNAEPAAATDTGDQSENEPPPPPTPEERKLSSEEEAQVARQRANQQFMALLPKVLFGGLDSGMSGWPESIALAADLDADALVVRALLVSEVGNDRPARPLPFVPLLLSGPALTPEAASVVPADTDVLVSASLDLPQMYDYVASMLKILDLAATSGAQGRRNVNESFESQLTAFEKANGFRIKEDLIAALGNEIAVAAPAKWLGLRHGSGAWTGNASGPIFIIALNDKHAMQALLPKVFEAAGLKGIGEQQLLEKHGDVELLTFSQGTIAFIDHFLVVSPDAATMRHVADAYNNHETLATSDAFQAAARWQPRQVLGQIYLSNTLVKDAFDDPKEALEVVDDAPVRDLLLRLNPNPGAVTHALTKDDQGLLHELHVPRDLLALLAADSLISKELAPLRAHEAQARYALEAIAQMESSYKDAHGRYASLEDIVRATNEKYAEITGPNGERFTVSLGNTEAEGYEVKLNLSDDKFEATATPAVYRKTGRLSFFIDQTHTLRAADLGGRTADASTPTAN